MAARTTTRRDSDRYSLLRAIGFAVLVNVVWTPAFFALEAPLLALGIIIALWGLIVGTVVAFDRVDRRAAALLVPYLAWVTVATALNFALWRLNA